jgi:hypothetical protein
MHYCFLVNSFIRAGTKFGGTGGDAFNDSSIRNFTCSHFLRGIITPRGMIPLNWFQSLYSSSHDPDQIIETNTHGSRPNTDIEERFLFEKDEKISKIQLKIASISLLVDGIKKCAPLIRAIRFFTTKGRSTPSIDHADGESFTEQFDGYTLGYMTGRAGLLIDQVQFHWYRTKAD